MIISHMIILIHQWPWRFPKSQISQAFIGVDVKTGQERLFVEATGALETATVFMAGCWMNMLSLTMISYKPINNSIWVDIFTWYLYDIYMIVSHDSYMIFIWYLYDIYMIFIGSYYHINGHFRNLDWRCLPYIRPIFQAYVREYPQKIWPYMVQYLHFRILKFPLII